MSCVGVILRDSHGVAQVKLITGNKILRVLKAKGMLQEVYGAVIMGALFRAKPQSARGFVLLD